MQGSPASISFFRGITQAFKPPSGTATQRALNSGNAGQRKDAGLGAAALRRAGRGQARGSEVLTGSTAPGRLGPAAPHGGGRLLGRRPGLPHWGGLGSPPQSLALEPGSGPHLIPGHGGSSSGLGTDGKSDGSAPGPSGSVAPADTSPTTALGSCISERERHPALSSQALEIRLRRTCQSAGARRGQPGALRVARVTRRRRGARQAGTCSPPGRGGHLRHSSPAIRALLLRLRNLAGRLVLAAWSQI
ncbi:protein SPT2 homolog [Acinonyx jubatus]|uniref:Protein SPT2 homolog n=1 Tax=Acinonyx jubatus TaxID=32536 RepID=A0ABM3N9C3_ACIJB|nr:protein SPT2 homolog [Acinonyx jubatus]